MKKVFAEVAALAALVVSGWALADVVDNPGPFNLTFDSGTIKIGQLNPMAIDQLSIAGSVDGAGNALIPAAGIVLPDFTLTGTPIGNVTIRFVPLTDGTGVLNPLTGEASAAISFRVRLINSLLPAACAIDPVNLALTTGTDGGLTGVAYSMDDGTATYVDNTFAVPRTSNCGLFGGAIDSQIGLPSGSGNNFVDQLHGTFDTLFVGS
jgi:hypothetical protein